MDSFSLIKKTTNQHEVYHHRWNKGEVPVTHMTRLSKQNRLYSVEGTIRHKDLAKTPEGLVNEIKNLRPVSVDDFITKFLQCSGYERQAFIAALPGNIRPWMSGTSGSSQPEASASTGHASSQPQPGAAAAHPQADTRPGVSVSSILNPQSGGGGQGGQRPQADSRPGVSVSSILNPQSGGSGQGQRSQSSSNRKPGESVSSILNRHVSSELI
ncbi:hypothetical protein GYMLUDRAFT_72108 [Collybiopsis luxurians FD-317 M1]|uniref:Uncharacterized protein n=1 Tax=Collybiopsis luxurians FD-317 M1 TaxID=944289 RepID=A0A0D0BHI7_9AGAR|nr:hypothetical protein GYMLUDRAFT_72108 [Collybiopsis luxurians FD-317 M1]